MAGSKKIVKQKEFPNGKYIGQAENPDSYYRKRPSWNFHTCDTEMWPFTEEKAGMYFWLEILPKLKDWEQQTWSDILVNAKKQNHSIDVTALNTLAQSRLADKHIEQEAVISLRLQGTHRLYGFITDSVFNILWFDHEHGDNDNCVCRSYKKHT